MARMSRRSLLGALAAILFALVVPSPAWASVTCSFFGTTLSISMSTPEDRAAVVRSGSDIEVTDGTNPVPCGGTPTVATTDQIQVNDTSNGTTEFTIDLSQGPFAPGFTDEGDGSSEIEFSVDLGGFFPDRLVVVGTGGADDMQFRSDGLNLNNGAEPLLLDKDVDVTLSGVEHHVVNAGGGADVIEGNPAFPAPFFGGTLILNGEAGNDTLSGGTGPDQLHGGDGNDTLAGDNGADEVSGDAGQDTVDGDNGNDDLFGGADADTLNGGNGGDRLEGGGGDDVENGDDGDDVFDQGASANGGDTLNGGAGNLDFDVAAYDLRVSPLTITVGGGGSDGEALEGDTVGSDVEGVLGGSGNDTITGVAAGVDHVIRGGGGADTIDGGSGDDLVDGDAGNDVLLGGAGQDTVSFFGAPAVTVDLASGSATGEGTDTLSGFENAEGGAFGDALIGDGAANSLTGRGGADSLSGGPGDDTLGGGDGNDSLAGDGGNDRLQGGGGADTASYTSAPGPVTVNLRTGIGTGDGSDTLHGIENAAGGAAGDSLTGNEQGNRLLGNGGADDLRGNGGNDDLRGGGGDDVLDGNGDNDTIAGGDGNDVLSGDVGADVFLESEQRRANGADQISGGPGRDLVTYAGRRNGVRVSIGAGKPDGQKRERDRVGGDVEKVRGTGGRDVLVGNGARNTLIGAAGNDILQGRGGRDRLLGGGGKDRLDGGPGRNVCRGGGGKNVLKNCGKRGKPRR